MRDTMSHGVNPNPMQTPHPNRNQDEDQFVYPSQPLVPEPQPAQISYDSAKRQSSINQSDRGQGSRDSQPPGGPPVKMSTVESNFEPSRVLENSQAQLKKKYDPNVFTIVNQKAALKKKVTSDLDLVIYIDGARFLPDNVNLTKLKVSFYNRDGKIIGNESEYTKMMNDSSDVYNPHYELKIRLSKDEYELTEGVWMICSLYTLDISQQHDYTSSVFFAYTILALSVTEKEGKDPFIWGFNRLVLNHGAFQLPLYSPRQTRETMEETILAME